ncbi:MAG: cell division protein FtsA [Bacteroidales bacterium]|nr:cell division protein FtsA [Bacteroidales bacterium]HQP03817.1 cell division protein FtsA [Bacteroidales bacterium]
MDNSIIAAIDIGTTKIVAITGKRNSENKYEILGFGTVPSKGIKRGSVLNIEEAIETIRLAVEKASEISGIKLSEVYVGIAGQHIRSMPARTTVSFGSPDHEIVSADIEFLRKKVNEVSVETGEEILHVIPQSYIVDREVGIKNPVGMCGRQLEGNFHVVIGQMAAISNIRKCVNRLAIKVNDLILEPLASSSAVLTCDEKEIGVAMVDIGGGTTDLAIYHDGMIVHTAVIPFGGNAITSDIRQYFNILERQAEELKKQYGSAIYEKSQEEIIITIPGLKGRPPKELSLSKLTMITKARVEEIIHAVMFQIETSGVADKLGAGIVICGGGALLKNIRQAFSYITELDVRVGYPNEYLNSDVVEEINQPQFATAVGLIMKGYELQNTVVAKKEPFDLIKDTFPGDSQPDEKEMRKLKEKERKEREKAEKEEKKKAKLDDDDDDKEKTSFMDKIKTTVSKLFDEDDNKF